MIQPRLLELIGDETGALRVVLYGTTATGDLVPVLVDSDGKLVTA